MKEDLLAINLSKRPKIIWCGKGIFNGPLKEKYSMGNVFALHFYSYNGELKCNGQQLKIIPNSLSLTPIYAKLEYFFADKICSHLCFHFQLAENFENEGYHFPLIQNIDETTQKRLEEAVTFYSASPFKCEIRLWDVLLTLVLEPAKDGERLNHPILQKALNFIEINLQEAINVQIIAEHCEVSVTHLGRLFQQRFQQTTKDFLRQRRIKRAVNLLLYTALPIKSIAWQSGFPNPQHFNKIIKQFLGHPPTKIRKQPELIQKVL